MAEKKRRRIAVLKVVIFVLIGVLLFELAHVVLLEKSSYSKYRNWKRIEDVDILITGNSHADVGLDPIQLEESLSQAYGTDIIAFNYAIFGMRMEQLYFFVKEALKTHVPDMLILETYALCPLLDSERDVLARRAFDMLPLSRNKIEAINYCVNEDRWSYYIPLIKYHSRWKQLNREDITLPVDARLSNDAGRTQGAAAPDACPDPGDGWFSQDLSRLEATRAITPTEAECLENLLALLAEKDIPLVFVSVPFKIQIGLDSVEMVKINNYLREHYVDDARVFMLDMNRMWSELDIDYTDLFNEGHLNASGANKATNCLADYLAANPQILARNY